MSNGHFDEKAICDEAGEEIDEQWIGCQNEYQNRLGLGSDAVYLFKWRRLVVVWRFDEAGEEVDEWAEKAQLDEDVSVPSYQHADHNLGRGLVTIWVISVQSQFR